METPLSGLATSGVDNAFFDQLEDTLGGQLTDAAELGEAEFDLVFEGVGGEWVWDFGAHGSYPQVGARVEAECPLEGGIGGLGGLGVGLGQGDLDDDVEVAGLLRGNTATFEPELASAG